MMNSVLNDIETVNTNVIQCCQSVDGLSAITNPNSELVIWSRECPKEFQSWLAQLDPSHLPNIRVMTTVDNIAMAIKLHLEEIGMADGEMREFMLSDIARLVAKFSDITKSEMVDVRLERIENDACWKFHRDFVEARLLTTYLGPTTEWVNPEFADQAINHQKDYLGPINRFGQNDVAIFKGNYKKPNLGIVHRSPPISGTGHVRVMLCLNKPSSASPSPWEHTLHN